MLTLRLQQTETAATAKEGRSGVGLATQRGKERAEGLGERRWRLLLR